MSDGEDMFRKRQAPPDDAPTGPPPPYGAPYPPPFGAYPPAGYPPSGYPAGYGQPAGAKPTGNLGWAIAAVVFFWPLAIAAFISYGKVDELWYRGDWAGAQQASESVKRYGIIALCIGLGFLVLFIGLFATVFTVASTTVHSSCVSVGGGPC